MCVFTAVECYTSHMENQIKDSDYLTWEVREDSDFGDEWEKGEEKAEIISETNA